MSPLDRALVTNEWSVHWLGTRQYNLGGLRSLHVAS